MATAAELQDWTFLRERARQPAGERAFWGVSALVVAASAAAMVTWCGSMQATGGMAMPGGWTMSMAWMRMPGQTWPAAAASFVGMWVVMMMAMMGPSLAPMLLRYRKAIARTGEARLGRLTALVGAGYFFVWAILGMAIFVAGLALASMEMQRPEVSRAVPAATGVVVLIAGAVQFTKWKANRLACCREAHMHGGALAPDARTAWRHGLRLGVDCAYCCAGLTLVLLVLGVMDLGVMAAVTAAISAERLLPRGGRVARAVGYVVLGEGVILIARAAGLV